MRLQKDYEIIDILINKKNDIISNSKLLKVKEQNQIQGKINQMQLKIQNSILIKQKTQTKVNGLKFEIERINQLVKNARLKIDN